MSHCFKAALSNLLAAVQRFPNAGDLNACAVPVATSSSIWQLEVLDKDQHIRPMEAV